MQAKQGFHFLDKLFLLSHYVHSLQAKFSYKPGVIFSYLWHSLSLVMESLDYEIRKISLK